MEAATPNDESSVEMEALPSTVIEVRCALRDLTPRSSLASSPRRSSTQVSGVPRSNRAKMTRWRLATICRIEKSGWSLCTFTCHHTNKAHLRCDI
jgi:hypothetical protein